MARLGVFMFIALFAMQWSQIAGNGSLIEMVKMNKKMRKVFVDAHNAARASVEPAAADMTMVKWNKKIAQLADRYARRCRFIHSTNDERMLKGYTYRLGENLYVGMSKYHLKPAYITKRWADEVKDYDISGPSCAPNKMCGHYTQVVWSTTTKIGCAISKCSRVESNMRTSPSLDIVAVCHYGPTGNWYGERPYKIGNPCSKCPADRTVCANTFCIAG